MATEKADIFGNYDEQFIYDKAQQDALDPNSRNFVVEFGQKNARIGFNLDGESLRRLFEETNEERVDRPVRWINIWQPHLQTSVVEVIAKHYELSPRLAAIICAAPAQPKTLERLVHLRKSTSKDDIESASYTIQDEVAEDDETLRDANHYTIASLTTQYQSTDIGEKFLCIGANWMHHLDKPVEFDGEVRKEERIWAWLILGDDGTVVSLHEPSKIVNPDVSTVKKLRHHTLSVLTQISELGGRKAKSIGMISVRQMLRPKRPGDAYDPGHEGASLLFYYLFDDWNATYALIVAIKRRLNELSANILCGLDKAQNHEEGTMIIKRLYEIGKQLRTNQHLYEGYKNLIDRILEFRAKGVILHDSSPPIIGKRITITLSASERFERLGDRINLIILSSLDEAISEKEALVNTHFNIRQQKDSEATAKLNENAALLSKLGVVFLPVSLMTSYFSIQIQDLQGVYTSTTYWVCFAVIVTLSVLALFFFSYWLVALTESVERHVKASSLWLTQHLTGRRHTAME
ncbi:MAG: hypothetical protein M1818_004393 [Claussenomyces sp. TS43310]|nr:MAG: hypothetical protein M1818_004393 [Claussenomyces sp. TS43310]